MEVGRQVLSGPPLRAALGETRAEAQGQLRGRGGRGRRGGQPYPSGEDPAGAAGRCRRREAAWRCHGNGLGALGGPGQADCGTRTPNLEDESAEADRQDCFGVGGRPPEGGFERPEGEIGAMGLRFEGPELGRQELIPAFHNCRIPPNRFHWLKDDSPRAAGELELPVVASPDTAAGLRL